MTDSAVGWAEVADLVGELAEASPAEREGRLAALDRRVREEVGRYLAAFDGGAITLERSAAEWWAGFEPDVPIAEAPVPETVGSWRLGPLVGRGGMGAVYRAVREADGYRQEAAIKMIRSDLASGLTVERFRREREVLARLRHRNIASLIDGGMTEAGLPWYAMELVDGQPITDWCETRRLDPPARLRLLRQACTAVHAAHRELIVHRDLKPGNILVTADGTVKLLDFGVAKLLAPPDPTNPDPTLTRFGAGPVTPNYASPEQLAGDPASVASDIYSLGVVAYQLLTGAVPFAAADSAARHRERVAAESPRSLGEAAGSVGTGWSPGRLRRWLRGDVDRVVQMALRKDPTRRYASADELGGDLDRVVRGLPVVARPDGAWYRFRRLVGRNRMAAAAIAVLAVGLIGAGAAAVDRARRAERARAAATAAAERSRRVTGFLAELLGAPDPWRGDRDVTVRELLRQAAARAGADFGDDPGVEAAVRLALGSSFRGLGQVADAREQLGRALALARAEGLEAERFAAERGLAEVTADEGELPLARAWYDSALGDARRHGDSLGVATVAADLAWLFGLMGHSDSAIAMADRAVALRRRAGADPVELANALNNQAVSRAERGDVAGARNAIDEAVALLRTAGRAGRPALAAALATRAGVLSDLGDLAAADSGYRESLALRRAIFGPGHPDEIGTLVNLGVTASAAGRPEEAIAWCDSVLARIAPDGLPGDHPLVAAARTVRGGAANRLGRYGAARADLEAALAIRRATLPPGHPSLAYTLTALGDTYAGLGRRADARAAVIEAVDMLEAAFGADHPRTRAAREQLVRLTESGHGTGGPAQP